MTDTGTERITVSYSELSTFRQCPLLHHVKYRERWTKETDSKALVRGTLWHLVQEIHWGTIYEWNKAHGTTKRRTDVQDRALLKKCKELVSKVLYDHETGAQTEDQALVEWMYEGYCEKYGTDRDTFKPLAIEHPIEAPLLDEHGRPTRFVLKARLDLIGIDLTTGLRGVVDHKSGANLPDEMALEIEDQFALYQWLLRQGGKRVSGSFHWAARTTRNQADFPGYKGRSKPQDLDQRFRRTPVLREDKELSNIALDAYNAAKAAYPDDPHYAPRYSAPDARTCGWKCDIKNEHLAMRKGRPMHLVLLEGGWNVNRTRH